MASALRILVPVKRVIDYAVSLVLRFRTATTRFTSAGYHDYCSAILLLNRHIYSQLLTTDY